MGFPFLHHQMNQKKSQWSSPSQDFEVLLKQQNFDVAFTFAMAFGCNQILAKSQIPWIGSLVFWWIGGMVWEWLVEKEAVRGLYQLMQRVPKCLEKEKTQKRHLFVTGCLLLFRARFFSMFSRSKVTWISGVFLEDVNANILSTRDPSPSTVMNSCCQNLTRHLKAFWVFLPTQSLWSRIGGRGHASHVNVLEDGMIEEVAVSKLCVLYIFFLQARCHHHEY